MYIVKPQFLDVTQGGAVVKKFIAVAAAIAAFGFISSASAADMPAKAPILKAAPMVATNWTGFYVNGGLGYGLWTADTTTQFPAGVAGAGTCALCVDQIQGGKGYLGLIGIGYDYQFAPTFLAGVFGDYNISRIKGTIQDQVPFFAGDITQTSSWAVGARLGWLGTPDFLTYVNAGYTQAHFNGATMINTITGAATGFSTSSTNANGWFAGIGTEKAVFSPGWFWRGEYRYASYNNKVLNDTAGPVASFDINFKPVVQTVTTQLVYKLNTGGPTYHTAAAWAPASWTGFYVNAGIGYGAWAADTTTQIPPGFAGAGTCLLCVNQVQGGKGWLGVVGIGYDYQVSPQVVVGVFSDFDISFLKGSLQDQGPFFEGDIKQTSAWAVGGRAGWLVTPQVLGYGNAGFTSARFSSANMVATNPPAAGTASGNATPSFTTNGWFLGSGAEIAVAPGWFWRTEYRYASYANKLLSDAGPIIAADINFKPVVQTFTTQAVYKFNWTR